MSMDDLPASSGTHIAMLDAFLGAITPNAHGKGRQPVFEKTTSNIWRELISIILGQQATSPHSSLGGGRHRRRAVEREIEIIQNADCSVPVSFFGNISLKNISTTLKSAHWAHNIEKLRTSFVEPRFLLNTLKDQTDETPLPDLGTDIYKKKRM